MKTLKKRLPAIALALVMAFALLPVASLAADAALVSVEFQQTDEGLTGLVFVFDAELDEFDVSDITEFSVIFMNAVPIDSVELGDEAEALSETSFFVEFNIVLADEGTYSATLKYKDEDFSAESSISEPEVPSNWAKEHIDNLKDKGLAPAELLSSYTSAISRDEFLALIWNIYVYAKGDDAELPEEEVFNDIEDSDYSEQILKAYSVGLTSGKGDYFDPTATLTREEMATFINRLVSVVEGIEIPDAEKTSFADNADISSWAIMHVAFCAENSLLSGPGNNMFTPKVTVTRETALTAMDNIILKYSSWGSDDAGDGEDEGEGDEE